MPKSTNSRGAGEPHFVADMKKVRRMSMKERGDIAQCLRTVSDILTAYCCQPRFEAETATGYTELNAAGEVLEELTEFLNGFESSVIDTLKADKPDCAKDVCEKSWAILNYEASNRDDLSDLAVLAAEAARSDSDAIWREAHGLPLG